MNRKATYALLAFSIVMLTGCMVGKKYTQTRQCRQILYIRMLQTRDTSALASWFEIYHDTALQTLIKMAIDSNRDLLAAASRMQEALALSGAVKANMYPQLSYQAAAGGGKAGTEATKVMAVWMVAVECIRRVELGAGCMGKTASSKPVGRG